MVDVRLDPTGGVPDATGVDRRIRFRWHVVSLVAVSTTVLGATVAGGAAARVLALPWWALGLTSLLLVLAAVPGVAAIREFADRGSGTPSPWLPPVRLITSGPFAYVRNPIHLSAVLVLAVLAAAGRSATLTAITAAALLFSVLFTRYYEEPGLRRRYGAQWETYRAGVRNWLPRRRPWVDTESRAYLMRSCGVCSATRRWLESLGPQGIRFEDAEDHPDLLYRMRYEAADGFQAEGLAAASRVLDRVHLGWAYVAWLLRLPVLDRLWQLIADSAGFGPRPSRSCPVPVTDP